LASPRRQGGKCTRRSGRGCLPIGRLLSSRRAWVDRAGHGPSTCR